ncbi:MAG: 5-(carboxyamino)imidazole ribonucleotide synthase [Burkholderiales bacterium]|nr:5-(carboxyamino)imidazole ribonucleotide synthase [Burkholderiales bacterium]
MLTVQPGEWLGMLGGGQLGRMFTHAAQSLGYKVCVLDPDADSPAGAVADHHLHAGYLDAAALEWLAAKCKAVTTEFENVPAGALSQLAAHVFVAPAAKAVGVAQDRIREKRFVDSLGIPVAPYRVVTRSDELHELPSSLFPAILKTARLGYDGKGQSVVVDAHEARNAFDRMKHVPCVLEKKLRLRQEVSCIVSRSQDGSSVTFPVAENEHRNGILAISVVPACVLPQVEQQARALATQIAQALAYVGVLCVEFFVLDDGRLVVNEIAPRPHNSGHTTIDANRTSQFEQQARILAGLPLGDTSAHSPSVMLNLLGDLWFRHGDRKEPPWADVLQDTRAKLHLYGKREPRPGRKMGHLTLLGDTREQSIEQAVRAAKLLGLAPPRSI